jgi:hypothetical protein
LLLWSSGVSAGVVVGGGVSFIMVLCCARRARVWLCMMRFDFHLCPVSSGFKNHFHVIY